MAPSLLRIFLLGLVTLVCSMPGYAEWKTVTSNAPWSFRQSLCSTVYNDQIWLMGGVRYGVSNYQYLNDVWTSPDGIQWTQVLEHAPWSSIPIYDARHLHVFKGKMWLILSQAQGIWSTVNGSTWVHEVAQNPWSSREGFSSEVYADKLWVFGGYDPATGFMAGNDVWNSDDGIQWNQVTSNAPWSPRALAISAVYDSKLWLFAGTTSRDEGDPSGVDDVWNTTDGMQWNLVTKKSFLSHYVLGIDLVYNNAIWFIGGGLYNDAGASYSEKVTTTTNGSDFLLKSNLPLRWGKQSGVVFQHKIWTFGGLTESGTNIRADILTYEEPGSLRITKNPVGMWREIGQSFELTVETSGTIGTVTYQWKRNGNAIPGANEAYYEAFSITKKDEGRYSCVVTDTADGVSFQQESAQAYVEIFPAHSLPCLSMAGIYTAVATIVLVLILPFLSIHYPRRL